MRLFIKLSSILQILLFFTGCFGHSPETTVSGESDVIKYYQLGSFPSEVDNIPSDSGELLPWTEQVRVADYTAAENTLHLALNNTGILTIPLNDPSPEKIDLIQDDSFFSGNTVKSLFYYENSIFCHIYHDTFFSSDYSVFSESPLIRLDKEEKDFISEFSRTNLPDRWEAVDFVYSENKWISSWKHSDEKSSSFRYFSHDIQGEDVSEILESEYRASLAVCGNRDSSDPVIVEILDFVREKSGAVNMTDISVKYIDCIAPENHRFSDPSVPPGSYMFVPVYKNSSHVWFLVGNDVYRMEENGEKEKILLDPLPAGFIYTGICCENSRIYLFWEYQSFFKTGKSGFLIIDEKRVDKNTI